MDFKLALKIVEEFVRDVRDGRRRIQDYGTIEYVTLSITEEQRVLEAIEIISERSGEGMFDE